MLQSSNIEKKQRSKNYITIQQVSSKAQVPMKEIKQMRKTLKNNNNIIPEHITVPENEMLSEDKEWNLEKSKEAIDMLILNANLSQRNQSYLSIPQIAAMCTISENSVRTYKQYNDNNK